MSDEKAIRVKVTAEVTCAVLAEKDDNAKHLTESEVPKFLTERAPPTPYEIRDIRSRV